MRACGRSEAKRDRRPAMNRLEKLLRLIALVLRRQETLPPARPGEALRQLEKAATDVALRLPERSQAIAFRNIPIHGYDSIDDGIVWRTIHEKGRRTHRCRP